MSLSQGYEPSGFGEFSNGLGSIDSPYGEVLPRLDAVTLCDALRRLPSDELGPALQRKLVPVVTLPGLHLYAACGAPALELARAEGLKVVAYAEASALIAAARAIHGRRLLYEATHGLSRRMPAFSARRRLTAGQIAALASLVALISATAVILPPKVEWLIASLISGAFFMSVIALRLLCVLPRMPQTLLRTTPLQDEQLPVYSVLVPLFRETSVLRQLLTALIRLDYPPEKLDIKLILEESDILMQRAVNGLRLPAQFDVIIVPSGRPQTKPRALNYALQFCRGSLLTIYDAEDVPDPDQLRKAAESFIAAPRDLACLQAQLAFYNPDENWITRQFTAEYASLFGVLLPALANHRLPLLLGGTSNHFRTDVLREVGAWDPYNVTEDADLGLRLARYGYDCGTLDSVTLEEANTRAINWMRQRGRWLKGFLATWLVHMREPLRSWQDLGPAGFWAMQAMTLGVFASTLLHPLCMILTVFLYAVNPLAPEGAGPWLVALAGLNLLVLVSGYAVTLLIAVRGLRLRGIEPSPVTLLTMPFYWMMMSAAAWYALWQFVVAPFHWNKTEHGLSRVQKARVHRDN